MTDTIEVKPPLPEGQVDVDIDKMLASDNWHERHEAETLLRIKRIQDESMSPAGALHLPELLDKRRLQFAIPDGSFKIQPSYDRIFVHQLPATEDNKLFDGSSKIIAPDISKKRQREEMPRGVLISAGLSALDSLRSNGYDLGHIVTFMRIAPLRHKTLSAEGLTEHVVVLHAGDLTGSEDTAAKLLSGELTIGFVEDPKNPGYRHHVYKTKNGEIWHPEVPWMPEEY